MNDNLGGFAHSVNRLGESAEFIDHERVRTYELSNL